MSVVVNVMLSLMSEMSPPPALCNLSVRTAVKLCIFGVLALGVSPMFPLAVHQPASPSICAVTPAGSVHKSRGDNVVRMWVQLKR